MITASLILRMMKCTVNNSDRNLNNKKYSDIIAIYFTDISDNGRIEIGGNIPHNRNWFLNPITLSTVTP